MVKCSRKIHFTIAAMAALMAFGTSAFAQTPAQKVRARLDAAVNKIQAACASDLTKYCSTVTPGEGRVVYCVLAYEDKISTKCEYALYEASRNLNRALDAVGQVADACWDEIEKRCANIPEGGGRIAQCLLTNKASIKKACQSAVEKLPSAK